MTMMMTASESALALFFKEITTSEFYHVVYRYL